MGSSLNDHAEIYITKMRLYICLYITKILNNMFEDEILEVSMEKRKIKANFFIIFIHQSRTFFNSTASYN